MLTIDTSIKTHEAVELLKREKDLTLMRHKVAKVLLDGLKLVEHHAKITTRIESILRKHLLETLGEGWHISVGKETYLESHYIKVYKNQDLPYSDAVYVNGKNWSELRQKLEYYKGDVTAIETTLKNIDKANEYLEKLQKLQKEMNADLPAMYLAQREFGDLYRFRSM